MKEKTKRRKVERKDRRLLAALLFLIKFNLLAIPMYLVMFMDVSMPAFQSFVASVVHALLDILGYSSAVEGYMLSFSAGLSIISVEINFDCTGWKSMYALLALVVATPVASQTASWKKKLKFLATGLPLIFVINIMRIVTTMAVAMTFGIGYLGIVHNILWREGLIAAVIAIWYLWLGDFRRKTLKNKN